MLLAQGEALDILGPLFTLIIIIAVGAYIVSLGTRSAHKRMERERRPAKANPPLPVLPPSPPGAFPVQPPPDGPGHFCIRGVDRETRMDTTWHCAADSEANARVKAELEGIITTAIEREPTPTMFRRRPA